MLGDYLSQTYSSTLLLEGAGNIFSAVDDPAFLAFNAWDQFDDQQPRMYLNYLFYDQDFNLKDYGFDQVSEAARIPEDASAVDGHEFEELHLEVPISEPGFLYLYVSNENQENVTAFFDDFHTEHVLSAVSFAVDYYPVLRDFRER